METVMLNKKYDTEENVHGVVINKACFSCDNYISGACSITETRTKRTHCCVHWKMRNGLDNAGLGTGRFRVTTQKQRDEIRHKYNHAYDLKLQKKIEKKRAKLAKKQEQTNTKQDETK